jgi:hypothetical protein
MSHTMKLWEMIIKHHLRRVTNVIKNQIGFMPGISSDFLDKTTYGEMRGTKERPAYSLY